MTRFYQILRWAIILSLFICVIIFKPNIQRDSVLYLKNVVIISSDEKILDRTNVLEYLATYNYAIDSLNITSSDLQNLEKLLLAHPIVKNAQVFSDEIGMFSINVETKEILMRVKNHKEDFYIDTEGFKIPLLEYYTPRVIVITGDFSYDRNSKIIDFMNIISESNFWLSQIMQLHFSNNEMEIIPRIGHHKIYFGDLLNLDEKLDYLYSFYKYILPSKGWDTYKLISLKYNNQIVCTKR